MYKKKSRNTRSSSEDRDTDAGHETETGHDSDFIPEPSPQPSVQARRKHAARRPPSKKAVGRVQTLKDIPERDYHDLRRINQYELPRSAGRDDDSFFHTNF